MIQSLDRQRVLRANVSKSFFNIADGVSANRHPFQDSVGITFQFGPVHVSARVAFITIANDVFDVADGAADKTPLGSGRKTGAAASSQGGLLYFFEHFFRLHLGERPG